MLVYLIDKVIKDVDIVNVQQLKDCGKLWRIGGAWKGRLLCTYVQVIVYMCTGYCVHVYRLFCTCVQVIVYMCTGYCVHMYRLLCTCVQVLVYMCTGSCVHVYWLMCTYVQLQVIIWKGKIIKYTSKSYCANLYKLLCIGPFSSISRLSSTVTHSQVTVYKVKGHCAL